MRALTLRALTLRALTMSLLPGMMLPADTSAQEEAGPAILVLGTYHMSNPGRDVANMQADDVLSARRQREIAELIEVLKRFRPTKIAVEASVTSGRVARDYTAYREGKYALSRNEVDQIGFRLAKELGHEAVYPVDEDGEFPYLRVRNFARANGLAQRFDSLEATVAAHVSAQQAFLRDHTVLETLALMNSDSLSARGVASYYAFVPFGQPYEYAGPDLLADWFKRNVRIYHNILALATSPADRILVVYGAGHLGILRQMVMDDPAARLSRLADLLSRGPARN